MGNTTSKKTNSRRRFLRKKQKIRTNPDPPKPTPIAILLEPKCTKRGVNRCLSKKQKANLLQNIQEKGIHCNDFVPEIKYFIRKNLDHRCARTVINNKTLDIHYTAPSKHTLEIAINRIQFPIEGCTDSYESKEYRDLMLVPTEYGRSFFRYVPPKHSIKKYFPRGDRRSRLTSALCSSPRWPWIATMKKKRNCQLESVGMNVKKKSTANILWA